MVDYNKLYSKIDKLTSEEDNKNNNVSITEAGLNRLLFKYQDQGYIIVSAFRSCEAEKQLSDGEPCSANDLAQQRKVNSQNDAKLRNILKTSGFGFIPVLGGYKEKGGTDTTTPEYSYIVVGNKVTKEKLENTKSGIVRTVFNEYGLSKEKQVYSKKLLNLGLKIIKTFNQDSFFFKPPNEIDANSYYIDQSGQKIHTFKGKISLDNPVEPYYTKFRKGSDHKFTFKENSAVEYWVSKYPSSIEEARKRMNEIFIESKDC